PPKEILWLSHSLAADDHTTPDCRAPVCASRRVATPARNNLSPRPASVAIRKCLRAVRDTPLPLVPAGSRNQSARALPGICLRLRALAFGLKPSRQSHAPQPTPQCPGGKKPPPPPRTPPAPRRRLGAAESKAAPVATDSVAPPR